MALGFGFASLFSFGIAMLTWRGPMSGPWNPGLILGVFFGVMAVFVFALSYRVKPDSWWRDIVGLDDESLKTMRFKSRN